MKKKSIFSCQNIQNNVRHPKKCYKMDLCMSVYAFVRACVSLRNIQTPVSQELLGRSNLNLVWIGTAELSLFTPSFPSKSINGLIIYGVLNFATNVCKDSSCRESSSIEIINSL